MTTATRADESRTDADFDVVSDAALSDAAIEALASLLVSLPDPEEET